MSEANLQVEGQMEKPAHRAADWHETEEEDISLIIRRNGPLSTGCHQATSI